MKNAAVSSRSGDFDCGSLTADSIDLSSSSGNIRLERIEGNSLQIETTSGKVEMNHADLTDAVSGISVSGEGERIQTDFGGSGSRDYAPAADTG